MRIWFKQPTAHPPVILLPVSSSISFKTCLVLILWQTNVNFSRRERLSKSNPNNHHSYVKSCSLLVLVVILAPPQNANKRLGIEEHGCRGGSEVNLSKVGTLH